MKDLVIVGAGGLGREVAWSIERINAAAPAPRWRIVGFADDAPDKESGVFAGRPLLGSCAKAARDWPDADFFIAVGDNKTRQKIASLLDGRAFPSIVDPAADIAPTASVSRGVFVGPRAVVSVDAKIGSFAIVNARAGVGHDSCLGAFSQVCPGASLSGATTLGECAFVGTNACTLPGVSVGDDAKIAAGTSAYCNVPGGATLSPFGTLKNPA